jgi:hypothetical protein
MALGSAMPLGEQALTRAYSSMWSRAASHGVLCDPSLDELACGEIDLAPYSRQCLPVCAEIVEAHGVDMSK